MIIAVGTKSPQKIEFLEEILRELDLEYSLQAFDVPSLVSSQPITSKETKKGSINRAKNALNQSSTADFSLGIEVGYHPNSKGDYHMFCWTSLVDNNGNIVSSRSHKLLLPKFHQEILKDNKNLGDYVRQYLENNQDSISQHVGIIIRDRKPFIQTSIKYTLIQYLVK